MPTIRSTVYTALAIFAAAPAAATIFLTWKRRDLAKRVTVHTSVDTTAPSEDEVRSIPQKLRDSPSEWVLSIERASKAVSKSQLPDAGADELLVQYLRTNMVSFTYTPQAPLLRAMCKAAEAKRTFEKDYLEGLGFEVGNLVCGVFRVVVRERGRVEMALDPHESFTGPRTEGRLVAAVEERGGDVVFFNDTLMWRRRHGGKPDLIESKIGWWLHALMVMWLVDSGVKSVMNANGSKH